MNYIELHNHTNKIKEFLYKFEEKHAELLTELGNASLCYQNHYNKLTLSIANKNNLHTETIKIENEHIALLVDINFDLKISNKIMELLTVKLLFTKIKDEI